MYEGLACIITVQGFVWNGIVCICCFLQMLLGNVEKISTNKNCMYLCFGCCLCCITLFLVVHQCCTVLGQGNEFPGLLEQTPKFCRGWQVGHGNNIHNLSIVYIENNKI